MQIGVDGCRAGWLTAIDLAEGPIIQMYPNFSDIIRDYPGATIAVDMVVGLPAQTLRGGRAADRRARRLLKGKGSSVFSAPCRAALYASTYEAAAEISRSSSEHSLAFSIQVYNIFPKIRELDQCLQMHPNAAEHIYETHPELCFKELHPEKKCAPSKHSKQGLEWRIKLLNAAGLTVPTSSSNGHKTHDLLDCLACLWTARRIKRDEHQQVLQCSVLDETGLAMNIAW